MSACREFETLLYERLLPEFCLDPSRGYRLDCLRQPTRRVDEIDAGNFLRAWHAGLIEHVGRGQYRSPMSSAREQFFWTTRQGGAVTLTLWIEPIITVATLARLHFDYGWPRHLIGMQSSDYAFDVVTHRSPETASETIACEVKKTAGEIVRLTKLMRAYGREPGTLQPERTGTARNAFKKCAALRRRRPPVFWAVGPGGFEQVFRVAYADDGTVAFLDADEDTLRFTGEPG